jgi:hypothetical protein
MNTEPASIQEVSDFSTLQSKIGVNPELTSQRTFFTKNPKPDRRDPVEKQSVDRIGTAMLCNRFHWDRKILDDGFDAERDV